MPGEETKVQLNKLCIQLIESKLFKLKESIKEIQASANSDTKSSMGDKYETGRAMAQLEIEKATHQKLELESQLQILTKIATFNSSETIGNGSLVICSTGNYYVSVSIRLLQLEANTYFGVSNQSPIGQKMLGLKAGGSFDLNGKAIEILQVF